MLRNLSSTLALVMAMLGLLFIGLAWLKVVTKVTKVKYVELLNNLALYRLSNGSSSDCELPPTFNANR